MSSNIVGASSKQSEIVRGVLTDEAYREYDFGNGQVYRIDNPEALYYRKGGTTHRIVDSTGVVHCVPFPEVDGRAVVLRWKSRDPQNPVSF